jgi:NADH-quinone oxidoreductase subunit N
MTWDMLPALLPLLALFVGSVTVLFLPARRALPFGAWCGLLVIGLIWWPGISSEVPAPLVSSGGFAKVCTTLWALIGAATCLLANRCCLNRRLERREFAALILFAVFGMAILSASTSLVSLFLGLEAMTLAFYVLVAFNRENPTGAEAGLKYLLPGFLASALLSFGIALVYAATGSFDLPEAVLLSAAVAPMSSVALLGWALILSAAAFKASLAPFHLWTPDVYQGAPSPVAGLLASGSKGAVIAALLGSMPLALLDPMRPLLAGLAALSMIIGTFAALPQTNIKRMLAYSSVVHMGYLVLALLADQQTGIQAGMFYVITYGAATVAAFGLVASMSDSGGEPENYAALDGLARRSPWRAGLLTCVLLSLAGFPPLAGFMGKFVLFGAALESGYLWLVILALLSSLVSCYYYLRPIMRMFNIASKDGGESPVNGGERLVFALCAAVILIAGTYPAPFFRLVANMLP